MQNRLSLLAILLLALSPLLKAQIITWGPASPSAISENINSCYENGSLSVEFTNSGSTLVDASIQIQLDTGINYVSGSLSFSSSGSATIIEDDISNLNRPIFYIGTLSAAEEIQITISRSADCEARTQKINGSSFIDTTRVYEGITEAVYSNGISAGTATYDIIYGSLSITAVDTDTEVNNLKSTSIRSMNITNGSFGIIEDFYFADISNSGDLTLSNFIINPSGADYSIPLSNISTIGDSIIIQFSAIEIAAIDGSIGTVGDGDNIFEKDETFVLQYEVTSNTCGVNNTISSELLAWFGCSYTSRCQYAENAASLGLTSSTPSLTISDVSKPGLDFCDTITYSLTLTNETPETSPAGGSFAKDVTAFLGFRSNTSLISTLSNITQWGSAYRNTKFFTNHKLNGYAVTLPTIEGVHGTQVPYLPPNYFNSDPDGPGGLTDLDGDGFYDDLPKDSSLVISYGTYISPAEKTCGVGRTDYIYWEHISADISWSNQCGTLMSPIRQEFNYTNHIRDYLNSTYFDGPTDVSNLDTFDIRIKPHLRNNGITCNGGDGLIGSNVEWITQVILPPGLSMKPDYDTNIYTVNNDTVTTNDSYAYEWTYFPLEFDCNDWDGANPLSIKNTTIYICTNDTDTCYQEEVHCFDYNIVPHCPGGCVGVTPLEFTSNRISESWTDNTKTALVDSNDPTIVKDIVYPFDTIELFATGVFTDTMSDQLYLRITYSPESGGNIFSFEEGTIEIVDIDGQYNSGTTNYTIPLASGPTVNSLGGDDYEMIFDLSSYRTSIDLGYLYGQDSGGPPSYDPDSIKVSAKIVISNTMDVASSWNVNNFRAEYFIYDASSEEVSCNSWGSSLSFHKPDAYAGDLKNSSSGCSTTTQRFYLTHRSYTGDDHPGEYRPPFQIDSAIISVPLGWDIQDVYWMDNSLMTTNDYELQPDRTLILRRPADYKDYDKKNTFYPKFSLDLKPNCDAISGKNYFDYTCYFKEYTYLTDSTNHVSITSTDNGGYIDYTAPTFSLTPLNQTVTAYEDTVQWNIRVCNSTSNMDLDYNWLLLENTGNQIQVDSVVDKTGGGSILLTDSTTLSGQTYIQIGGLDHGVCADLTIYSSFSSCDRDTLNIKHGWSCSSYPTKEEVTACGAENEVYILPQSAQISATITTLTNTPSDPANPGAGTWGSSSIDMCSVFPAEVMVINAQPAYLYNVNLKIKIPSTGAGLTYVPGSATIEIEGVDVVNTPRSIGAAAESALISASNNGDQFWIITLAQLDPTNYGNGEPFSGTLNSSNNEFILRWEMESTCDLISGDFFNLTIEGNDPCGTPAAGSGEQVNGPPINLNGVSAPYFSFITVGISPDNAVRGCDDSKTIDLELLLTSGTTGSTDSLKVILPDGIGYNGGYVCNTPGKCPTYIGSSIINGEEVLMFKYPSGQTGTIDFSFDITTDNRGGCNTNDIIAFQSTTTVTGLACGGGSCASTEVFTGNEELSLSIEKPILSIQFNSLIADIANTPYAYDYEIEILNTGIDTENDVIIEFYCLNATGDDISGSALAKDTVKSIIQNGNSAVLSGSFGSLCDPSTNGVAVLIVPEYENCYCSALESMGDKSSGLSEIPHDKINNVTLPIDLREFSATANDCEIMIQWKTEAEMSNNYIDLLRSFDGDRFIPVERFQGSGNTVDEKFYEYNDQLENFRSKVYYKLKQVDHDGSTHYSKVIQVELTNCNQQEDEKLVIYPNPIKKGSSAYVTFENNIPENEVTVNILSIRGATMQSFPLMNINEGKNTFSLDLTTLPGGTYMVIINQKYGKPLSGKMSVIKL